MNSTFTAASYNILANAYVRADRYPHTDPLLLAWKARGDMLLDRIRGLDADIVCLQEVEWNVYLFLEESLHREGYDGSYAQKGNAKPDGCAILYRRSKMKWDDSEVLHYNDEESGFRSGHMALLATLEAGGSLLTVANTHLKWDRPDQLPEKHPGYREICELMARYEESREAGYPWIVCGDFNAEAESPIVRKVLSHGFLDAYRDREQDTCNPDGRAKRIDYLFHSPELTAEPRKLPIIDNKTPLPSEIEPSDHLPIMATFSMK